MFKRALISVLLVSAGSAFAQLDSNSVTVWASRSAAVQADQANFSIGVASYVSASLADVLAALEGSSITASNLISIGTQISTQALQSVACSIADLLSDARTQAQKIADASVLTLGPILAISGAAGLAPACSITVKFGLVRFQ